MYIYIFKYIVSYCYVGLSEKTFFNINILCPSIQNLNNLIDPDILIMEEYYYSNFVETNGIQNTANISSDSSTVLFRNHVKSVTKITFANIIRYSNRV